jgi:hypothetical protein
MRRKNGNYSSPWRSNENLLDISHVASFSIEFVSRLLSNRWTDSKRGSEKGYTCAPIFITILKAGRKCKKIQSEKREIP